MLLNQTDVVVDEELEKVSKTIYSSTETDIGDKESGYEYSSGETLPLFVTSSVYTSRM